MLTQCPRRSWTARAIFTFLALGVSASPALLMAQNLGRQPIVLKVQGAGQRIEMVANSSRILTLDQKIPQAQVNNPEVLEVTPLSPTKVQIFAKTPGVTQVNLWDENNEVHSIDVVVFGDARELTMLLKTQFPKASLKVIPLANSVVISGYVDDPDAMERIIEIAEDFHPKVINNIRIGGVQQVMLHTKIMEVSRTKLRKLGVDFAQFNGDDLVTSGISGLVTGSGTLTGTGPGNVLSALGLASGSISTQAGTMMFGIVDGSNAFYGFLDALRQNNLMKVLAEPDLVTVSGRPATFNVGGEFPILVPQSLGTVSVEFKKFGTQMDFVPIVQGNERIRLEVRPRVSEIDDTRSVQIGEINVPGLRVREVNTAVEMRAGQSLALAGLVQSRVEAEVRGLPWVGDLPYIGAMFRRTTEEYNEIELLILVTPYLVAAMDQGEVPEGGPGTMTCSPTDHELHFKGKIEVPCNGDGDCAACQQGACDIHGGGEILLDSALPEGYTEPLPPTPSTIEATPAQPMSQQTPKFQGASISTGGGRLLKRRDARAPAQSRTFRRASAPSAARRRHQTGVNSRPAPVLQATPRLTSKQPGIVGPTGYDVKP